MAGFPISKRVRDLALSDVHKAYPSAMPRHAPETHEPVAKQGVLELLRTSELINLTTLGPHGWPETHCMHFCTVERFGLRPVIYMSTHFEKRKLANVRARPQVSLSLYRALGFEERRKTKWAQMQAVCAEVDAPDERKFALEQMHQKPGYEFTNILRLEDQAMLRADVVFVLWGDNEQRPQKCTFDYRAAIAAD